MRRIILPNSSPNLYVRRKVLHTVNEQTQRFTYFYGWCDIVQSGFYLQQKMLRGSNICSQQRGRKFQTTPMKKRQSIHSSRTRQYEADHSPLPTSQGKLRGRKVGLGRCELIFKRCAQHNCSKWRDEERWLLHSIYNVNIGEVYRNKVSGDSTEIHNTQHIVGLKSFKIEQKLKK